MKWAGYVAGRGGRERRAIRRQFLQKYLKERERLEELGGIWVDNIEMDVRGMGLGVCVLDSSG
jgi:hypothetical protein